LNNFPNFEYFKKFKFGLKIIFTNKIAANRHTSNFFLQKIEIGNTYKGIRLWVTLEVGLPPLGAGSLHEGTSKNISLNNITVTMFNKDRHKISQS
jgi:hypothetical protein